MARGEWLPEQLPEDPEAEASLLATCLAPGASESFSEVLFALDEHDFAVAKHRLVFQAALSLLDQKVEVSPISLKDELGQMQKLHLVGGYPGLTEVLAASEVGRPTVLVEILRRKRRQREIIRLGTTLVRQAVEDRDPRESGEEAAQALFKIMEGRNERRLESFAEIAADATGDLFDRLEGRGITGLKTGFSRLDALTQGFKPGNLIILAARPGIGKSTLVKNWLTNAAVQYGSSGAFFTLEMGKEEVWSRMVASGARVDLKDVEKRGATDKDFSLIRNAIGEMAGAPIYICDQATITVQQIEAMVARHVAKRGKLDFLVVDYLQLMSSPSGSRGAKQNEAVRIGEISRGFKLMAKDFGIPIVVLSQLNREVEHRQGGRPQLSDLRDSGSLEQDADMVMFIHRKMAPVAEGEEPDRSAELILAKHRNGPTGIVPLYFQGEYFRYMEMERTTS